MKLKTCFLLLMTMLVSVALSQIRDASSSKVLPSNSASTNVTNLARALAQKGYVTITRPGNYSFNATITIPRDTRLELGPGVVLNHTGGAESVLFDVDPPTPNAQIVGSGTINARTKVYGLGSYCRVNTPENKWLGLGQKYGRSAILPTVLRGKPMIGYWNVNAAYSDPAGLTRAVDQGSEVLRITDSSGAGVDLIANPGRTSGQSSIIEVTRSGDSVIRSVRTKNLVQVINMIGSPTGGTFQLSFRGVATSNITYSAALAASTVQTALEGLSTIGSGNVTVAGSNGGPYTVTFGGALAGISGPRLDLAANALTGGSTPSVAVYIKGADSNKVALVTESNAAGSLSGSFSVTWTGFLGVENSSWRTMLTEWNPVAGYIFASFGGYQVQTDTQSGNIMTQVSGNGNLFQSYGERLAGPSFLGSTTQDSIFVGRPRPVNVVFTYDGVTRVGKTYTNGVLDRTLTFPLAMTTPSGVISVGGSSSSGGTGGNFNIATGWISCGYTTSVLTDAEVEKLAFEELMRLPGGLGYGNGLLVFVYGNSNIVNWNTNAAGNSSILPRNEAYLPATSQFLGENIPLCGIGSNGQSNASLATNATLLTQAPYIMPRYGGRKICVIEEWTNSLSSGVTTVEQAIDDMRTLVATVRSWGATDVIVGGPILRSDNGSVPATPIRVLQVAEALRATNGAIVGADAIIDYYADPVFGGASAWTNSTYYKADNVHLTNAGCLVKARLGAAAKRDYIYSISSDLFSAQNPFRLAGIQYAY